MQSTGKLNPGLTDSVSYQAQINTVHMIPRAAETTDDVQGGMIMIQDFIDRQRGVDKKVTVDFFRGIFRGIEL